MKRISCIEQGDLFPSSEIFRVCARREPPAPLPELPALPFPRNQEIDVRRAARILNTDISTIPRLIHLQLIDGYKVTPGKTSAWRIRYSSLVEHCDRLRVQYLIPPRPPSKGSRPLDADVLPFPASETISLTVVLDSLDISAKRSASKLIDTGNLVGYRLIPADRSPWRIHRPSLVHYIENLRISAGVK